MEKPFVAKAVVNIKSNLSKVWDALINPAMLKQYFFGAEIVSEWKKGSEIRWKGVWKGKDYEDKGKILEIEPENLLKYTHYSPLSGLPDAAENYHTLTYTLAEVGDKVKLTLSQDNNADETARQHSENNWQQMLNELKRILEADEDKWHIL